MYTATLKEANMLAYTHMIVSTLHAPHYSNELMWVKSKFMNALKNEFYFCFQRSSRSFINIQI